MARKRTKVAIRGLKVKPLELPKETATYLEVANYYKQTEYFKRFRRRLERHLLAVYGEDVRDDIESLMDGKRINIINYETFFDSRDTVEDADLAVFNNSTTLERYLRDTVYEIKRRIDNGVSYIPLTYFLIHISFILEKMSKEKEPIDYIQVMMNWFIVSISTIYNENPVVFRVLDTSLLDLVHIDKSVNPLYYYYAVKLLYHAINDSRRSKNVNVVKNPRIELLHGIYPEYELQRVKNIVMETKAPINDVLKEIENVDLYNFDSDFYTRIQKLQQLGGTQDVPTKDILENLDKSILIDLFSKYNDDYDHTNSYITKAVKPLHKDVYVEASFFKSTPFGAFVNIEINCANFLKTRDMEIIIDLAALIGLVRMRKNLLEYTKNAFIKLTLTDLVYISDELLEFIKKKKTELVSKYERNFEFELRFSKKYLKNTFRIQKREKVIIISDIHHDINKNENYNFMFGKAFVANCGDTSGDYKTTTGWVKLNMHKGVFVHGNHLGYGDSTPIEDQIEKLKEEFPLTADISYLNNAYKEYNGIIFIGACLYTNFELYGKNKKEMYMDYARVHMNDFRYPTTRDNGSVRILSPEDHEKFFNESLGYLYETLLKFKNRDVVVITHHAPLPFSISEEYKGSPLNPAFANDLRDLIDDNPNIKIWCHGHMHTPTAYYYNKTLIMCSPFGYFNENNMNLKSAHAYNNVEFSTLKKDNHMRNLPKYTRKDWN